MAELSNELVDQLTKSILALDSAINKLDDSHKELQVDIDRSSKANRDNKTTSDNLKKGLDNLKNASEKLTQIEKDQKKAAEALDKQRQRGLAAMAKQEAKERDLISAATKQAKSVDDLKAKIKALTTIRDRLDRSTKDGARKFDLYTKEIVRNRKELKKTSTSTGGLTSKFKSLLGILGVGAGINILKNFGKELFNLSTKLEGDSRRANIVFGESLGFVEQEAKKLSKRIGITNKEFIAAAAATGDLLIPLDFTRESSAKMSVELQSLSGALSEWTGGSVDASEVSEILTKAMLGENEQLKRLGIAIRKDTDEFRDLVKINLQAEGVTKAQAEALATLTLIQKKSADAQTAFNLEGNKLLRWQKSASRQWRQLKENIVGYFDENPTEKIRKEQAAFELNLRSVISLNEGSEIRKSLLDDLIRTQPKLLGGLDSETVTNTELLKILKDVNAEYQNKIQISVLEEEIAGITERGAEAFRKQRDIVVGVNSAYAKYIKNQDENATFQDKLNALQNESAISMGTVIDEWANLDDITGAVTTGDILRSIISSASDAQGSFNDLQAERNGLQGEYNELLQEVTLLKPEEKATEIINTKTEAQKEQISTTEDYIAALLRQNEIEDQLAEDNILRLQEEEVQDEIKKELRDAELEGLEIFFARKAELEAADFARKKELANAEIELDELKKSSKESYLGILANLFGRESTIGKLAYLAQRGLAIARIITDTAVANAKAVAASPLTLGQPFVGINTITAKVSIAAILAQAIKGFKEGTKGKHNTPDTFITSEPGAGVEAIEKGGKFSITTEPTLHTGMKGARVYSNPELVSMVNNTNVGSDSREIQALRQEIKESGRNTVRAIKNKRELIIDNSGKIIGQRKNNHTTKYAERMMGYATD